MVTVSRGLAAKTDDDPSRLESPPPLATAANDLESTAQTGARENEVSTEASRAGREEFSSNAFNYWSPLAVLATSITIHGSSSAPAANGAPHSADHNLDYATTSNSSSNRVAGSRSGNKRPHASAFTGVAEHKMMEQRMVKLCKSISTFPRQQPSSAITAVDNDSSWRSHADVADFPPNQLGALSIQAELASGFRPPSKLSTPRSPDITSRSRFESSVGFSTPCGIQYMIPRPDRCPGAPRKAPHFELLAHHSCTSINTANIGTGCRCGCMGFETGEARMQRNVQCRCSVSATCISCGSEERTWVSRSQITSVHTSMSTSSVRHSSMVEKTVHAHIDSVTYASVDRSPTAAGSGTGVRFSEGPHPSRSLRRLFRPLDFGCGDMLC